MRLASVGLQTSALNSHRHPALLRLHPTLRICAARFACPRSQTHSGRPDDEDQAPRCYWGCCSHAHHVLNRQRPEHRDCLYTTGKTPILTAIVIVDNKIRGRFPLFDVTLPSSDTLPLKVKGNTLALGTANITLDASASAMLNDVYHVSQFTPGFPIGTADITHM